MIRIALDPGQTGALAAIDGRPARILVERAQPMPGQRGISSTFGYGVVMGSILAACQRIAVPMDLVTAAAWKNSMGLGADKQASHDRARLQFRSADLDRKKGHNRAEALLLAEYSRRTWSGRAAA